MSETQTSFASLRRRLQADSLLLRLIGVTFGAVLLDTAFPSLGWWPCAIVAMAVIFASLDSLPLKRGVIVAVWGMLVFYAVHIQWATLYLGPVPWLALSILQALLSAAVLTGWLITSRKLVFANSIISSVVAFPLLAGCWWLVRETVTSHWPYGGFSWAQLAFSQSEGWFAAALSWIGAPGVSFLIAAFGAVLYQIVRHIFVTHTISLTRARSLVLPASWLLLAAAVAAVPVFAQTSTGTLKVAAVQGAGPAGYFTPRERGDLLAAQVDATRKYVTEPVDIFVWPEDGSDIDPLRDEPTRAAIRALTEEFDAPITFGTITKRGELYYNSSLLWEQGQDEPNGLYDKLHPIPFGEYVPHRSFYSKLAPGLIGLIKRDYEPGERSPVMQITDGAKFGVAICFDIAYFDVTKRIVDDGGQVIFAQSNNGDFGRTDESAQQLAIARVRAIEAGRDLVNISTVGHSAIIHADGSIAEELPWYEPGALVDDITLYSSVTPAMRIGPAVTFLTALGAIGSLVVTGVMTRRQRTTSSRS